MTAGWCEAGGVALRYRVDGEAGPWLVLVHEMGGTIETWDRVVPLLEDRFQILRFDMRGSGLSEKVSEGVRIEDLADDLAALLDALAIAGPVLVAGCAVGAALALCFAARHPARSAAVVAMNPAVGVAPANLPGLLDRAERLRGGGTRAIVDEALEHGYPEAFRAVDPQHFAGFRARWLGNDPVSLRAQFLMLAEMNLGPALAAIACPVLGISGRHDPLRPTEYVREVLAAIPGSRLVVIEAGHHMADQAPAAIAGEILAFAQDLGRPWTGAAA